MNEKELLARLKNDQTEALEILYNQYWEQLFLSAMNLLKDKELCEEIVQDVFITIWNKRKELNITASLKGYLYAMVRFKVFNHLRSSSFRTFIPHDTPPETKAHQPTAESNMIYKEYENFLLSIISDLPERCKQVYRLSRYEELSHKEIAARLNISSKTVENHINKALYVIREALKALFGIILMVLTK